jgi:hypothetical protein
MNIINSNYSYNDSLYSNKNNPNMKNQLNDKNFDKIEISDNKSDFNNIEAETTILDDSGLNFGQNSSNYEDMDDNIIQDIQKQLNCNGTSFTP